MGSTCGMLLGIYLGTCRVLLFKLGLGERWLDLPGYAQAVEHAVSRTRRSDPRITAQAAGAGVAFFAK